MSINFDKAFGIHPLALQLHAQRSEMLAANLANADTPGYKARDLDFQAVLKNVDATPPALRMTQPDHIAPRPGSLGADLMYRVPSQPSLDGNTVESHIEQAKFAENALHYQASLRFLNGRIAGLMTALKGE